MVKKKEIYYRVILKKKFYMRLVKNCKEYGIPLLLDYYMFSRLIEYPCDRCGYKDYRVNRFEMIDTQKGLTPENIKIICPSCARLVVPGLGLSAL